VSAEYHIVKMRFHFIDPTRRIVRWRAHFRTLGDGSIRAPRHGPTPRAATLAIAGGRATMAP
jgi:hypothetical protein